MTCYTVNFRSITGKLQKQSYGSCSYWMVFMEPVSPIIPSSPVSSFSTSRLTEERYNTDVDIGIGNVDRTDTTSPYYNKLNQYHNGGQSYGIDEPDARFSTSPNSIPNSQAQNRLSGYFSTLPRASVGSGPTYPDSMVSSKNFPVSPPGTLKGADPTISFSTPAVSHDSKCTAKKNIRSLAMRLSLTLP